MDARPLVQIRDLTKTYERGRERIEVLHHINLDIPHGDFVALMGPSGSGKTTLLNLIGGLDNPSGGEISIEGERIDQMSGGQLSTWRSHHVGFVFQFYNLMPMLTAQKNVELPLLLTHLSAAQRKRNAEIALTLVGLADRRSHRQKDRQLRCQKQVAQHKNQPRHGPLHQSVSPPIHHGDRKTLRHASHHRSPRRPGRVPPGPVSLRILAVASGLAKIVYRGVFVLDPVSVLWETVFVLVNVIQLLIIWYYEYQHRFSEEQQHFATVFRQGRDDLARGLFLFGLQQHLGRRGLGVGGERQRRRIGQPRDGQPSAMYALFDLAQARLTFHRVPYDHMAAAAAVLTQRTPLATCVVDTVRRHPSLLAQTAPAAPANAWKNALRFISAPSYQARPIHYSIFAVHLPPTPHAAPVIVFPSAASVPR